MDTGRTTIRRRYSWTGEITNKVKGKAVATEAFRMDDVVHPLGHEQPGQVDSADASTTYSSAYSSGHLTRGLNTFTSTPTASEPPPPPPPPPVVDAIQVDQDTAEDAVLDATVIVDSRPALFGVVSSAWSWRLGRNGESTRVSLIINTVHWVINVGLHVLVFVENSKLKKLRQVDKTQWLLVAQITLRKRNAMMYTSLVLSVLYLELSFGLLRLSLSLAWRRCVQITRGAIGSRSRLADCVLGAGEHYVGPAIWELKRIHKEDSKIRMLLSGVFGATLIIRSFLILRTYATGEPLTRKDTNWAFGFSVFIACWLGFVEACKTERKADDTDFKYLCRVLQAFFWSGLVTWGLGVHSTGAHLTVATNDHMGMAPV